jgi:sugar phosphate permease
MPSVVSRSVAPRRLGYLVLLVGITAVAAFWLYIDRVCFSTLADPIQTDLGLSDAQKELILGAFFFTYALFQIPIGSLADRFGPRRVLAVSIIAWSLVTATTGVVAGFVGLLGVRFLLGITEAGAYPAAAGLIKRWAPVSVRGVCSSVVTLGGRIGGAVAPYLTAWLAIELLGVGFTGWFEHNPSGVNWRGVFVLYGLCGLAVAGVFWLVVRDRPAAEPVPPGHPELAAGPVTAQPSHGLERTFLQRLVVLIQARNMWLYGAMQFGVNMGWIFLVTLLPTYLNQAFAVPLEERGRLQSTVLVIGLFGMVFGGLFTDLLRAWLGPRLGRSVPLGLALGGCSVAFFLIPTLTTVWAIVVALGVMAFLVDLHNPTVWSFAQDVGGKHVGTALGFGNMWGNLGAALSPVVLGVIARSGGWDTAFLVCGVAFASAAACGLLLDATRPLDPADG